jgi:hypothetical protein
VLVATSVVAVEILASARKHGISDDDIDHAIDHALGWISHPDQPDFTMLVGPDRRAALLEVGVLQAGEQEYVIHAMQARRKYLKLIGPPGGDPR